MMLKIVVQPDIVSKIRQSDGQIELVDDEGNRVGVVRRPPSDQEIATAKARIGSSGPKTIIDQLIAKVESL